MMPGRDGLLCSSTLQEEQCVQGSHLSKQNVETHGADLNPDRNLMMKAAKP